MKKILPLKPLLTLLILCITGTAAVSQQLRGTVRSEADNHPIAGVTVMVDGTGRGTATDTDGTYLITRIPAGTHTVEFRFMGMVTLRETIVVRAGENLGLDVVMKPDQVEMENVVVSRRGDRSDVLEAKRQGVPVSVIDGKTLAGRGSSISEVLNHQTGVKIRQTGGLGSEMKINVRGLEGNRVQVYMDGHPLNSPDGSFSINDIPLQFIDRIEIYKGIVPPEFGGDGLGSAINVVTIEPEYSYYDLWYSYKSYNTHEGSAVYKHYLPKSKMYISGFFGFGHADNNYKMDSPYVEGLRIKRNHDQYRKYDGAITLDLKNAWFDEFEIENVFFHGNKEMQGIQKDIRHAETTNWIIGSNPKLEKEGFLFDNLDMKFNGFAAFGKNQLADTSSYQYNFDGERYPTTGGGEIGSVPNLSDDRIQDYRYILNLKYHLTEAVKLNLNSDFRHVWNEFNDPEADRYFTKMNNGDPVNYSGIKARVTTLINSLNLENRWFDDKLTVMLTGRNYHYRVKGHTVDLTYGTNAAVTPADVSKNRWGYSLAVKYDFAPHWLIKLALEKNYRLPKSEELLGDRVTFTPNKTGLLPEQAQNYNFGIMFDKHYGTFSRLQLDANAYLIDVKDMMQTRSQNGFLSYYNIGKAQLYGADLEVKWDINRHWFVMTNATFQRSIDKMRFQPGTNTANPGYDSQLPHIPVFFVNWALDYRTDNLFGGRGQYTRFYYEGGYTNKYYYGPKLGAARDKVIPSADIHTAGLEYGIRNRTILFSVECHNLFDKHELTNLNYPLAGRTIQGKIRFTSLKW